MLCTLKSAMAYPPIPWTPPCCITTSIMHWGISVYLWVWIKSLSLQSIGYVPSFALAQQIPDSLYFSYVHFLWCNCFKWGKMFIDFHTHILKILEVDLLAAGCFSIFFLWKHFQSLSAQRPTDGSSEALQCYQNLTNVHCCAPLLLRFSGSAHPDSCIFITSLSPLQKLVSTSEVLLHLCLFLCPGLATEGLSNTRYFDWIAIFLSSVESLCSVFYIAHRCIKMQR